MEPLIIGIDHGYAAIKTKNACFPSGLVEYEHEPYTMKDVLEYGGKYYVCGSGRQPLIRDKTSNDNYYLLSLAALAKEIDVRTGSAKETVIIAAGLPLTGFGRDKRRFKEYLMRSGEPICFRFESRPYEITIRDVALFPQGYSAILAHMDMLQNEPSVILADIGGWTVDVMRLDNALPDAVSCRSLELGMIRCLDEIGEQVRRSTGLSMSAAQIETVLKGDSCTVDERARKVTLEYGRRYALKLLSAIAESGFDTAAMPVIFMGGGSALMKRHVSPQDGLCRAIILEDACANAAGYERIVAQTMRGVRHE